MLDGASVPQNHSDEVWVTIFILVFFNFYSHILIESRALGMSLGNGEGGLSIETLLGPIKI
jgi:hypothetical protein